MSVERTMEAFFAVMVLVSVVLTQLIHPAFMWLTVFVGANLLQQSITRFCPLAMGLRKAGMKTERELGSQ